MAEHPQLAQLLAEVVSELRVLRRELATATEALPAARPPQPPPTAGPPAPVLQPTAAAPAPPSRQPVAAMGPRPHPARLSAEAFQKPHRPLAPRSPASPSPAPRAYSWEASVTAPKTPPADG